MVDISVINLLKFGESVVYNKSHQTLGKELSEYKAFKCLDFSRSKTLKLELSKILNSSYRHSCQ